MIKKPLVLTDGEIEQLQPSDLLLPVPNNLVLVNNSTVDLVICTPVYVSATDAVDIAHSGSLPNVIGIVTELILIGVAGTIQTDGKITATTAEWDARTGQTGGLTPGATYFLGDWGALTATPPATGFLTRLGIATNSTDLGIKISRPIKL